MAYKTKREKQAYRTGLLNGLFRALKKKKKRSKSKKTSKNFKLHKTSKKLGSRRPSRHKMIKRRIGGGNRADNPFGMTYRQLIREEEARKRDLFGDFDYDSRGRIKGSYVDGKFEPD